jgi:cation:H+ antiporter
MALIWIEFFLCFIIILVSARKVASYGDVIADKTGIGRLWVGLILLSIVTSLPELFSGIGAVVLVKEPDLAIGGLFGSNAFNLMILALLDISYQNRPLLTAAGSGHLLPSILSIVLVAIATVCIFIGTRGYDLGLGWIGIYTPILILLYIFSIRAILIREKRQPVQTQDTEITSQYENTTLGRAYIGFTIAASFVIGAGIWLAFIGDQIAENTGWGESFVGSLFIALTTSLPEISVSFAALRLGAVDMSIGNIVGSNLFNMTIIGIDDIFYCNGPILSHSHIMNNHIYMGLIVIAMTVVVITALVFRSSRKIFRRFSWYVPILIMLFLAGAYVSFITSN